MTLLIPSRRGFLTGLASLLAAPAVVRAASLMPVAALQPAGLTNWLPEDEVFYGALQTKNPWLTLEEVTREAVRLFRNPNKFIRNIDAQYASQFAADDCKIGSTLRIRLPSQWDRANVPA